MCLTVMQLPLFAKDESETDTTEKGEFCCVLSVRTERKKLQCEIVISHTAVSLVLYAVDKGLCGRNVLQSLLLILLRICSRSVRPIFKTATYANRHIG